MLQARRHQAERSLDARAQFDLRQRQPDEIGHAELQKCVERAIVIEFTDDNDAAIQISAATLRHQQCQ